MCFAGGMPQQKIVKSPTIHLTNLTSNTQYQVIIVAENRFTRSKPLKKDVFTGRMSLVWLKVVAILFVHEIVRKLLVVLKWFDLFYFQLQTVMELI